MDRPQNPRRNPVPQEPERHLPALSTPGAPLSSPTDDSARPLPGPLSHIPEEAVWLASQKSERTRRAYRTDVQAFMETLGIRSTQELRSCTHREVILWERHMRETEGLENSTVRRRLAALSSLFRHLIRHSYMEKNPATDISRPSVNRSEGSTPAFSREEARKLLDAPDPETLVGLRDRALLSVGFQAGLRRSEIAHLSVEDFYTDRGYASLRILRKGGKKGSLAIHQNCAQRIQDYLDASGHGLDPDAPLFLPTRHNRHAKEPSRHLDPDTIDRIVKRYVKQTGTGKGGTRYSAHSMRATFITTALDNGSPLEDVQRAAGHADPSTTKLYDRRGYSPEKSASFFANY
ncbi:MAG TPA: tyrosine-type recombinase/integrase [Verrucomicrobiales bacterium]|nr:tyrosine-type recombinase/integrase [Verrucomicrobiales bacterium]